MSATRRRRAARAARTGTTRTTRRRHLAKVGVATLAIDRKFVVFRRVRLFREYFFRCEDELVALFLERRWIALGRFGVGHCPVEFERLFDIGFLGRSFDDPFAELRLTFRGLVGKVHGLLDR